MQSVIELYVALWMLQPSCALYTYRYMWEWGGRYRERDIMNSALSCSTSSSHADVRWWNYISRHPHTHTLLHTLSISRSPSLSLSLPHAFLFRACVCYESSLFHTKRGYRHWCRMGRHHVTAPSGPHTLLWRNRLHCSHESVAGSWYWGFKEHYKFYIFRYLS